eukprot:4538052-Prymnesium_polylepis.1
MSGQKRVAHQTGVKTCWHRARAHGSRHASHLWPCSFGLAWPMAMRENHEAFGLRRGVRLPGA